METGVMNQKNRCYAEAYRFCRYLLYAFVATVSP